MKPYTETEIQTLINSAYMAGWRDRELRRDGNPTPPPIADLVAHPRTGSDDPANYPLTPSWLNSAGGKT